MQVLESRLERLLIDSNDPEILDLMVGVSGHHKQIFNSLPNLQSAKLDIKINSVITPYNINHCISLVDFLGQFSNIKSITLSPYGRSIWCHQDNMFVERDQVLELKTTMQNYELKYPHIKIIVIENGVIVPSIHQERQEFWNNRGYCTGNRDGFVILPSGKVTVCEELNGHPEFIMGDLATQSVMEMWNSNQALSLIYPDQNKVPDGSCKNCSTFLKCHSGKGRCWRDVVKCYGWDRSHLPDPSCPMAPPGALRLG